MVRELPDLGIRDAGSPHICVSERSPRVKGDVAAQSFFIDETDLRKRYFERIIDAGRLGGLPPAAIGKDKSLPAAPQINGVIHKGRNRDIVNPFCFDGTSTSTFVSKPVPCECDPGIGSHGSSRALPPAGKPSPMLIG